MDMSFEQKEREHLSKCISTRLQGRQVQRGNVVISISKNMLRLLETLKSNPLRFHEIGERDNNKAYTINQLLGYGFIKRIRDKNGILQGKRGGTSITATFYITEKGNKFLEILEMPNEL